MSTAEALVFVVPYLLTDVEFQVCAAVEAAVDVFISYLLATDDCSMYGSSQGT
jgi:hypothetical protein